MMRVCSVTGCPNIYPASEGSQCKTHRRAADRARGTAAQRGYRGKGHQGFRNQVLERDTVCVICETRQATEADHYPYSRKELVDYGLNPNDPSFGRGLCATCHKKETAKAQPGGWQLTK
ncbi:5-methylcytosine-specific restriction protein A [Canibacter oris]|uniref:5-methylcytosine-specific restriction protein A n=1 Tax=Canibacter oris TaxID=1365628 RepID=A0A840DRC3_9MICO|nr:5-methylcytosine-specific restriction protein A [Canibacter oris]